MLMGYRSFNGRHVFSGGSRRNLIKKTDELVAASIATLLGKYSEHAGFECKKITTLTRDSIECKITSPKKM
jgi:hypothetical protein